MAARGQHRLLQRGSRAPEFRLPLLGGGETTLAEILARGPVLLAFFKTSCPVCQLTFPFLDRVHAAATLPGTLQIYGVSQNDPEDTREFNQEFGVTFPTLLDTEESGFPASNNYGISSVPTLFLVERDRTVSQVIEGWQRKHIEGLHGGAALFRPGEYVPEWKAG
jgi:peroxiredoxin